MLIRAETPADHIAVRGVNRSAFDTFAESKLVDVLRKEAQPLISLVAEGDSTIFGHIMLSPAAVSGHTDLRIAGLGPMAVMPERQRCGIGSALVRASLEHAKRHGFVAVVVVGHPNYYPRFGFVPAKDFGLLCEFDVPSEAWMATELVEGALADRAGHVSYHAAFGDL